MILMPASASPISRNQQFFPSSPLTARYQATPRRHGLPAGPFSPFEALLRTGQGADNKVSNPVGDKFIQQA